MRISDCSSDVCSADLLSDPAQALRLKAYIWPEHRVRFGRIEAAIAAAKADPPDLVQANAADFIEAELAKPQAAGTMRVLMHSVVWQYVPADQQARVTAPVETAAARATAERDRKRSVQGTSVLVQVYLGGVPHIKKKNN